MANPLRILRDPESLLHEPEIGGPRIAVEFILEPLAAHWSEADLLAIYPQFAAEDILACLARAHDLVEEASAAG